MNKRYDEWLDEGLMEPQDEEDMKIFQAAKLETEGVFKNWDKVQKELKEI